MIVLYIGDRAYSSWSLRGWLLLRMTNKPFETRLAPMYDPAFDAFRADVAPSRTVPTTRLGDGPDAPVVWDSLAIAETLAEDHPHMWPKDRTARAAARSVTAEMHAGFQALRDRPSMNLRRHYPDFAPTDAEQADADRVMALWRWARAHFQAEGPYLFGAWSIADAFYAPVCTRFVTYNFAMDPVSAAYVDAAYRHPDMRTWITDALADPRVLTRYDQPLESVDGVHAARAGL